jgi:hypothetical protein
MIVALKLKGFGKKKESKFTPIGSKNPIMMY